jgi:hypothetical protein
MAIIRSIAIGKARNSAGNVTFRTVRGRTIASEKVGPRPVTRSSAAQQQREAVFGLIARFARMHKGSIAVSFNKSKFGSQRNYFMTLNYAALNEALEQLAGDVTEERAVTDDQIEAAITAYATVNPGIIVRINRTGFDTVYLAGAWTSVPDPEYVAPSTTVEVTSVSIAGTNIALGSSAPGLGSLYGAQPYKITIVGKSLTSVTQFEVSKDATGTSWDVIVPDAGGSSTQQVLSRAAKVYSYALRITYAGETKTYWFKTNIYIDPDA